MKAYVIERAGGPEDLQLRDVPAVRPRPDEVRIRVRAFGLNRSEVYRPAGKMRPIAAPGLPGIKAVGEVLDDALAARSDLRRRRNSTHPQPHRERPRAEPAGGNLLNAGVDGQSVGQQEPCHEP